VVRVREGGDGAGGKAVEDLQFSILTERESSSEILRELVALWQVDRRRQGFSPRQPGPFWLPD
jgi:hypothetical protein